MPEAPPQDEIVRFERFVLDGRLRELRCEGVRVPLQPKPMALLWYLIRNRERVIPGEELLSAVWPDVHVGDHTLAGNLRDLRRALKDQDHRLIETLRGHGYRFTGQVAETVGRAPTPEPPPSDTRPRRRSEPALVGRADEMQRLRAALERASNGNGSVCVLLGAAGIGKTRLADELTQEARDQGFALHRGTCHSGQGAPPFWPWSEVARSCLESAPDLLGSDWLAASRRGLRSLLPDLDPDEPTGAIDRAQARFEISQALIRLLEMAGRSTPRIVVIEDLHWADPDSLAVLEVVTHSVHRSAVCLLATVREDESEPGTDLRHALAVSHRSRDCEWLPLGGLDPDAVESLLRSGASPPAALVQRVRDVTGGNPLFVTELARLYAQGQLSPGAESFPVPVAVRDVMELQMERRSPACREALRFASVSGDSFLAEVVRRALDWPLDRVLDVLSTAETVGLIEESLANPGSYRFRHSLWREFLYEGFSKIDARRAHLRTGEALEAMLGAEAGAHASILAHHFWHAAPIGGAQKSLLYQRQAAERCEQQHALREAAMYYQRAIQALDLLPDADPRIRAELHIAQGVQLREGSRRLVDGDATRKALQSGILHAREAGASELLAPALQEYVQLELEPFLFNADLTPPRDPMQALEGELLTALRPLGEEDAEARARILLSLAYVRSVSQELGTAVDPLVEAERIVADLRSPELEREVLLLRYWMAQAPDEFDERQSLARRLQRNNGRTHRRGLQRVGWLASAHAERGDLEAAYAGVPGLLSSDTPQAWEEPEVLPWRVLRAVLAGRLDEAERLVERAETVDSYFVQAELSAQGLWLRGLQGRGGDLIWLLEMAVRGSPSAHPRLVLARAYIDTGELDKARDELRRVFAGGLEALRFDQGWLSEMYVAAEVVYLTGDATLAPVLYEALAPYEDRFVVAGWLAMFVGSVARPLGLLAAAQKSWDVAVAHLEKALAIHEQLSLRPFIAYAQIDLAHALTGRARRLDVPRARELARAAAGNAAEMGMTGVAALARAELERLGDPVSTSA